MGELTAQLQAARTDKRALNTLLRDYMPFIKKCLAGVLYKEESKADNLTEAMLAFVRSVQTYQSDQGAFVQYAAAVIRHRLIDNARRELLLQKRFLPFSALAVKEDGAWENGMSLHSYDRAEEENNLRLEIEEANEEFARWGFSWAALLKKCPRQERSRRMALRIAEAVLQDAVLLENTLKTRQLPVSRLAEIFPRKAVEKYRQYIAALVILSQGDFPYVYSFVPHPFTEEENK
ncbi:MAG: hypothetical protein FWH19_01695 [Treponema sp.]|nr:hypothetical protein [Treponema sp.]